MQIPVSLVDVMGSALHRNRPVSESYWQHYSLGLFSNDREEGIKVVGLKLKKPCPFLEENLCSIYPVRPLPCILFPEDLVFEGTLEARAREERFREYLCLHRPMVLSRERAEMVAKLRQMWEREDLISSHYLFGYSPCHLDCRSLRKEVLPPLEEQKTPEILEHLFLERIAGCQPFAGVPETISRLDEVEGREAFMELLQDELLLTKLKRGEDGRAFVFRYARGKLKVGRRSLFAAEYKYY